MTGAADHPEDRGFFRDLEIGFVMHELKGPLAVIEAGVRTMLDGKADGAALSPRQERTLQRMLRSTLRSRELVAELLAVGQSERGALATFPFKPAEVLQQVVMDCLEMVPEAGAQPVVAASDARALERAGVTVSVAPEVETLEVDLSESAFRHVCSNLVRNALRFKKDRVTLRAGLQAQWLEVDVADDGPGIPASDRESIFQPYVMGAGKGTAAREGHGLGLSIARTLARRSGGDVMLMDSDERGGATFRLKVPLSPSSR